VRLTHYRYHSSGAFETSLMHGFLARGRLPLQARKLAHLQQTSRLLPLPPLAYTHICCCCCCCCCYLSTLCIATAVMPESSEQPPRDHHHMSFAERKDLFGLASPEESKQALTDPKAFVLDLRSPDEIEAAGGKIDHPHYRHSTGTPEGCPALLDPATLDGIFPDKEATILVHCKAGKRAGVTQQFLLDKGYKNVLNAGGYDDIKDLLKKD
jgi:phage shock protein E